MTFAQLKHLILAAWVASIAIVGVLLVVDRPGLWILFAGLALVPAAIGTWFWNAPVASLSQRIAAARSRS
jgi:hypothetical protein